MDTGLLHLHNLLRWVIIILLLISIFKAYSGWQKKRAFTDGDRRVWLFTMISAHITLLLGLYQWLWGRFGMLKTELPEGESVMQNKFYRFFWVEHPTFMILAIIFITLGYRMSKKPLSDELKFKRAFWLFIVALLMILVAVPWPFREGIARPLFPGM
ncbi:MAG: cytochrome B [Sphingobacteriales bacterium]|nr:cytochrome B [Sphingobacteriales bacterium]OJW04562.1 MAG: hypothetical protein BGO52_18765 [Sphingobacteriales bacterium 44-61]